MNLISLVLENALEFKRAIDAIAVLIDEAEFVIDKQGLSLKATDPSQISMVDFLLPASAFRSFNVEGPAKIGLGLDYVSQVMARAKAQDELLLELEEEKSRLLVVFRGAAKRSFSIPLLDVSSADLPTPKIEFESEVTLSAGALQDGLKDASLISTHIVLGVSGEKFILKASSSKGEMNSETSKKDKGLIDLKSKSDCRSMFPLDYLSDMLKAASSDTETRLFLKADSPVKVSYAIGKAQLTYFLAPRIESGSM